MFNSLLKFLIIVAFSLIFGFAESFAQYWRKDRAEIIGSLGSTNFLGELGGRNSTGSGSFYDLELNATRPAVSFGYRYSLSAYTKIRGSLSWGVLSGNDQFTGEPFRHNRNLHFRSQIVELSGIYEIYFNRERGGHRYSIAGAKGMRAKNSTYYGFIGIGGFYFNPKAFYNGSWVALQPLGTEGQGLPGEGPKYSRLNVAVPIGLGMRYAIDEFWKIGVEIGYRKTFTDYIDDVSTEYYDNDILRAERGDKAADIADPNKGAFDLQLDKMTGKSKHDMTRGNPNRLDSYLFAMFSINYTIKKKTTRAKF